MERRFDFVLVHGAWCGGWIWSRVADRLTALGHRVFTPTLSGLEDEPGGSAGDVDLDTHIAQVAQLIVEHKLTNLILVGHSYAGMVISGAVEQVPEGSICALVYLDAFLPDDGRAVVNYAPLPPVSTDGPTSSRLIPPIPAAPPRNNPADVDWLNERRRPQPLATFTEPVRMTGALERIRSKTYVLATGYPSFFGQFADRVRTDPDWRYRELACGHDLMLSHPDETVAILLEAGSCEAA